MKTAITGGTLITQDPRTGVVDGGTVIIEDGTITEVLPEGSVFSADVTIDASGCAVIPGFINAHTHAAMTLFRGYADDLPLFAWLRERIWPVEARLSAEHVYHGTRLAIAEMLLSGITCFADMYFEMDAVAQAVRESGIRAVLARGMIADSASSSMAEAIELFLKYHGKHRIQVMLGPHAPYTCPPDFLVEVAKEALSLGARVHIHLAETAAEVEEMKEKYGRRPAEILVDSGLTQAGLLCAHCVHVDKEEIRVLAEAGAGIALCPVSNAKLAAGFPPVTAWLGSGTGVGLGTDGAGSAGRLDLFDAMRAASFGEKLASMDPRRASAAELLTAATSGGARALGIDHIAGSITTGKIADLVVVDLDTPWTQPVHDPVSTLVYAATAENVRHVFVEGQQLVKDRALTYADVEDILESAKSAACSLFYSR
ncbi:MAG: amidohydrolase [Bacillota bacterium]